MTESRRDFLRLAGGAVCAPLAAARGANACIIVWLGGGLSHLDTFDMKPDAPREIRGEFRSIATSAKEIRITEHLPRTARIAHKLTILRSMHAGEAHHERASGRIWNGLGPARRTPIEAARRAVEEGARLVVTGSADRTWDTHADGFERLRDELLPEFDRTFPALVTDLDQRGLLATTLVVALSEFGRTPRVNSQGGRDHHAGAWSVVLAGAGLAGGRVLGRTDRTGTEVTELPVTPEDLAGAIRTVLGREQPGTNSPLLKALMAI
jgi:uncharacterized protein (DUF1501 family)